MNEANVPLSRIADAKSWACMTKKSNTVVLLSQTKGTWYDKIHRLIPGCLFLVSGASMIQVETKNSHRWISVNISFVGNGFELNAPGVITRD